MNDLFILMQVSGVSLFTYSMAISYFCVLYGYNMSKVKWLRIVVLLISIIGIILFVVARLLRIHYGFVSSFLYA